ncbi:DUF2155 domain-containing protein [Aestuariivirga litoralis]|uniref:DUF2155 domain-containing protein n=1 Tax=Aestuariivirga litoralis TaxID=2650924 RepID=UPI0018C6DA65|nr:DUF2155 domain-containing protein [Aestuariivirga litoralis]MBG1231915.1 DUF2155 domain-containing protein [Aestuariivirga litoralis]
MKAKAGALALLALLTGPAAAEIIQNPIAVFSGLDKIMGQTTSFDANIGEEKKFGSLVVKAETCDTRPITEDPKTVAFVEVDEERTDGSRKRIFSGWMFAESPGLNAVEHPLYDVWLTGCRDPNAPPPPVEQPPDPSKTPEDDSADQAPPD